MKNKITKIKKELKVDLTREDKLELSERLSECITRKKRAEDELKAYQADKKSSIQQLEGQINYQSELIRRGYDYKDVECSVEFNFKTGVKTITRLDSGLVIAEDPIHPSELQTSLLDHDETDAEVKPSSGKMREVI